MPEQVRGRRYAKTPRRLLSPDRSCRRRRQVAAALVRSWQRAANNRSCHRREQVSGMSAAQQRSRRAFGSQFPHAPRPELSPCRGRHHRSRGDGSGNAHAGAPGADRQGRWLQGRLTLRPTRRWGLDGRSVLDRLGQPARVHAFVRCRLRHFERLLVRGGEILVRRGHVQAGVNRSPKNGRHEVC